MLSRAATASRRADQADASGYDDLFSIQLYNCLEGFAEHSCTRASLNVLRGPPGYYFAQNSRITLPGLTCLQTSDQGGLPAAHPDADGQLALAQLRRASGKVSSGLSDRSQSPISRTGTPNFNHPSNIAPQHMFEQALSADFHSPSLPGFGFRAPSPANSSMNGSHLEAPLPYDTLAAQNTALKTRVSEFELVQDLYKSRVKELEDYQKTALQTEQFLRQELEQVRQREADLKRRIEEIEEESPRHKKMKLTDFLDESRAGTPISAMME
jgi:GATA-binding protein